MAAQLAGWVADSRRKLASFGQEWRGRRTDGGGYARSILLQPPCQVADQLVGLGDVYFPGLAQELANRGVHLLAEGPADRLRMRSLPSLKMRKNRIYRRGGAIWLSLLLK
jgi:hypothetical protein